MTLRKIQSTQIDTIPADGISYDDTNTDAIQGADLQAALESANHSIENSSSTGVLYGGAVTVDTDTSKVDISAGEGIILDNSTPSAPVYHNVTWSAADALTPPAGVSYYYVDSTGTIQNTASAPTAEQRRTRIYLAQVSKQGGVVTAITSIVQPTQNLGANIRDLSLAIGPIREAGLVVSAGGTDLSLQVSAGTLFYGGVNFQNSATNPNSLQIAAKTAPATFRMVKQDGPINVDVTQLPVTQYDNGGTLTNVPNGSNATIFTVFQMPSGNLRVLYDQTFYSSMTTAEAALPTRSVILPAGFELAFVLGWIIAKKNCTDLSNTSDAKFISSNRFGLGGGGGGSSSGTVTSVDVASGGTYSAALSVSGGPVTSSGTITVTPNLFTSSNAGVVPASGGGTSNYLRADGTWTAPAGGSSSNTYKEAVRVATTANGTLASAFENGDTVDGVTLATGDRILIKDQSTASENGIYTVNASGAPTRATDFDTSGAEVANGAIIPVQFGTVNGGSVWQLVQNGGTIGNSFRFAPVNGVAGSGQSGWTSPTLGTAHNIAIGSNARSSGSVSSISIGSGLASGSRAIAIGSDSLTLGPTSSGIRSIVIGSNAQSNGSYSIAIGGNAAANVGAAICLSATSANVMEFGGQIQFNAGGNLGGGGVKDGVGITFFNYWRQTTDATTTELGVSTDGSATNTPTGRIILSNDVSYIFDCDIIARNTGTDTESKAWNLKFAIRRGTSAANTALIGSATKTVIGEDTGTSGWDVSVTADTTNGRPNISVTGEAGKTIRWVANIHMTRCGG